MMFTRFRAIFVAFPTQKLHRVLPRLPNPSRIHASNQPTITWARPSSHRSASRSPLLRLTKNVHSHDPRRTCSRFGLSMPTDRSRHTGGFSPPRRLLRSSLASLFHPASGHEVCVRFKSLGELYCPKATPPPWSHSRRSDPSKKSPRLWPYRVTAASALLPLINTTPRHTEVSRDCRLMLTPLSLRTIYAEASLSVTRRVPANPSCQSIPDSREVGRTKFIAPSSFSALTPLRDRGTRHRKFCTARALYSARDVPARCSFDADRNPRLRTI